MNSTQFKKIVKTIILESGILESDELSYELTFKKDLYAPLEAAGFRHLGNQPNDYMEFYEWNFATIQIGVNLQDKTIHLERYYDNEHLDDKYRMLKKLPLPKPEDSAAYITKFVALATQMKQGIRGDQSIYGDMELEESTSDLVDPDPGEQRQWTQSPNSGNPKNGIDGQSNNVAASRVNKILADASKGLFSDNSWEAVNNIFKKLKEAGAEATLLNAKYGGQSDSSNGMPTYKEWKISIPFTNNKGKSVALVGQITAHGAGSVEQPLDKYDITAYVTAVSVKPS